MTSPWTGSPIGLSVMRTFWFLPWVRVLVTLTPLDSWLALALLNLTISMTCSVNFLYLEAAYSLRIFIYSICGSRRFLLISLIYWSTLTLWRFLYGFCSLDIYFKRVFLLFLIWKMFVVKIFLHIMVSNRKKLESNLKSGSLSSPNLWIAVFGFCFKVILCPDELNELISPLHELETVKFHFSFIINFLWCSPLVVRLHFLFCTFILAAQFFKFLYSFFILIQETKMNHARIMYF